MKSKTLILTILFMMFLPTACGTAFQPAQTISPTGQVPLSPELATSSETPPLSTPAIWSMYHNNQYGFRFEYPSAYAEASYKDSCGIKENNDGIHLGHQIYLLVLESNGLNLTDFATNLLQRKGWISDSLKQLTVSGEEAVSVEYRFGGANRFGTITLIDHNARIFALNFSAGSFCDIPEAKISESEVYSHVLETIQFIP